MLQSIIELANDGILVFNDRLGVEYANRAIAQITGYPHARILEMSVTELLGDESRALVEDLFSHPEKFGEKTCQAVRIITSSGDVRNVELCIAHAHSSRRRRPGLCLCP